MITVEVDPESRVAVLKPEGLITESDCETVTGVVDPFIREVGPLDGVIVQARKFPGWDSFKSISSHMRFRDDQHEKIPRVALVSDSGLPEAKQVLGEHFSRAEIECFPYEEFDKAKSWVKQASRH